MDVLLWILLGQSSISMVVIIVMALRLAAMDDDVTRIRRVLEDHARQQKRRSNTLLAILAHHVGSSALTQMVSSPVIGTFRDSFNEHGVDVFAGATLEPIDMPPPGFPSVAGVRVIFRD